MDCEGTGEVVERGQRDSKFKKPASTVARRGTVVDKHLLEGFEAFGNIPRFI